MGLPHRRAESSYTGAFGVRERGGVQESKGESVSSRRGQEKDESAVGWGRKVEPATATRNLKEKPT